MSQENFIAKQIEEQKKMLLVRRAKVEKGGKTVTVLAILAIMINVVCLLQIPFMAVSNGSLSMQQAFEYEWEQLSMVKLMYTVNWVAVGVVALFTVVAIAKRATIGAWVTPQMLASLLNFACILLMYLFHMTAEIDVSRATSSCATLWFIPLIFSFIYFSLVLVGWTNKKVIAAIEKNVAAYEKD